MAVSGSGRSQPMRGGVSFDSAHCRCAGLCYWAYCLTLTLLHVAAGWASRRSQAHGVATPMAPWFDMSVDRACRPHGMCVSNAPEFAPSCRRTSQGDSTTPWLFEAKLCKVAVASSLQ